MSRENIETMRRALEAFNRHDVEVLTVLSSPDVELVTLRAAMEGTSYRGPDAFPNAFRDFDESWEDLHYDLEEFREGSDSVLALGTLRGRGRGSGVQVEMSLAYLVHFEHGLIRSFRTYSDRAEALEAAGLED
jgi:ketosteroid isomerase-like protein